MQAARRQRALEAAAEVTDAVLGDLGRADALRLVAQRARELTHTDFAAVLLRQRTGDYSAAVVEGAAAAGLTSGRLELKHGAAGQAVTNLKPVIISERLEPDAVFGPGSVDAGWPAIGPALLVPMTSGEHVLGLLVAGATTSQQDQPSPDDLNVMSTLAGHAALALDRVSAREQQQQLVVFEDRDRIARDLHDIVIQRLFATGLQIQGRCAWSRNRWRKTGSGSRWSPSMPRSTRSDPPSSSCAVAPSRRACMRRSGGFSRTPRRSSGMPRRSDWHGPMEYGVPGDRAAAPVGHPARGPVQRRPARERIRR